MRSAWLASRGDLCRSGPARQLLPGAVCLGWQEVCIGDGYDWRGGGGALVLAGAAEYSRPDEWIKVEGSQLSPVSGRLSLRFTEPMEEVNYIDQLRLRAIDHPEGTEVYPNERFLDDPPFADGSLVVSTARIRLLGAWDDHGRDVLSLLSARDHKFVSDFTKLPYDGFANQHALTLDLGDGKGRGRCGCC
jgi:hypothetical protein